MGKNIYEKILSRAAGGKEIKAGETMWLKPDLISLADGGWRSTLKLFEEIGLEKIADPGKVVGVIDHCTEQIAVPEGAENNQIFRGFAKKYGVKNFHDVGKGGMMCQVMAEQYVLPGMAVLSNDPEVQNCGALGAFTYFGDTTLGMVADEFLFEIPEFVKYKVTGKFQKGVMSTDLKRKLLGDFGGDYGKYIEFVGPAIDEMSMDERMNLCALLYMSDSHGIIAPDETTVAYLKSRHSQPFEILSSDPDATYAAEYEFDVSTLEPQVSCPPSPNNVKGISALKGTVIHSAAIGSCASGRLEDLRIAAEILKGRKVHADVRLTVAPASQEVLSAAAKEGLLSIFAEAGALINPPSCGACPGHTGRLAAGEVFIGTTTGNNPGRIGSKDAAVYLASPAAVAAAAVAGEITDPREFF